MKTLILLIIISLVGCCNYSSTPNILLDAYLTIHISNGSTTESVEVNGVKKTVLKSRTLFIHWMSDDVTKPHKVTITTEENNLYYLELFNKKAYSVEVF